jgi:site-specific recombinase XerC
VKRNTSIGLALAVVLCGMSPINAEPLQKLIAKSEQTGLANGTQSQAPSAVRQLFDFLLRKQVAPADAPPVRKIQPGIVPLNEDFDLPPCDEIPDPSVPCRVISPVQG